jgi:predicted TIM-barrel fold metal-dependent hydrolase
MNPPVARPLAGGPIIDAHVLLGQEEYLRLDAAELLRRMDRAGVERAVARPMGSGLVVHSRQGNDALLQAGDRIHALVSANPWSGADGLDELARCYDLGAVGLFLHPARQGFMPTEGVVQPLLERAAGYRWPVMFHTGTYVYSDILAVAEVARQFPEMTFIAGFAGFADMWFELPGAIAEVPNLRLETAMIWGEAVQGVVAASGAERVLFASGEPRNHYAVALAMLARFDFTEDQLQAMLAGNARKVYGLP